MSANYRYNDFFQKRPTESQTAFERRIAPYAQHREDAQADATAAHAEFRRQQETRTQGTGYGLAGDLTPQQRAASLGAPGAAFAGDQRLVRNGGYGGTAVPGSVALSLVTQQQIRQTNELPGSPLARYLRGDTSRDPALPVHERWT